MDKETLSNYGWIVICVLVLAVMIALAGPFGTFVAGAVKSTTAGLFGVNQNALGAAGITIDGQDFDEVGNGGSGEQGGAGDQGGNKTLSATFADNSWEQIIDACQNNEVPDTWNLGDIKTMSIKGVDYRVRIIGKNHDTYADASGKAPLTFQVIDFVSSKQMNPTTTNVGGWNDSSMYNYLNSELIDGIETTVKNNIKAVTKYTNIGYADAGNKVATAVETSSDKLFLLSRVEVVGLLGGDIIYADEGNQYEYYANGGSASLNNNAPQAHLSYWWTRTPNAHSSDSFFYLIDELGRANNIDANRDYGVAFAFCF